ncbi:MAG: hypothetical protein JSV09_14445 [Thermoplasmata archaeon]|nr:MAG: hypothetical protein JSV09_14445 [Thermoplasmata archaeon]
MEMEEDNTKCHSCGGILIRARKFIASTNMYWNKPWGSALKMSAPVIPFACMNCGRVYLFLSDRKKIIREFNDLPESEQENYKEA